MAGAQPARFAAWSALAVSLAVSASPSCGPPSDLHPLLDGGFGAYGGGTTTTSASCVGSQACKTDGDCGASSSACAASVCASGCCHATQAADGTPCTDSAGTVCVSGHCAVQPTPAGPLKILVLGPNAVAPGVAAELQHVLGATAGRAGSVVGSAAIETGTSSGTPGASLMSFYYYPDTRAARLAVLATGWDYVAIIEAASFAVDYPELYFEGVRVVGAAVRAAGARPLLVMPWVVPPALVGESTYRVGNGTWVPVVPAGYAVASAPTPPAWDAAEYAAATSIFTALTGAAADATAYAPAGMTVADAAALAAAALSADGTQRSTTHYTTPFQGLVEIAPWPASASSLAFMTEGSSSEALYTARMVEILPEVSLAAYDVALGYTNPAKVFDAASLAAAAAPFAARQFQILFARGYDVDAATIRAKGAQTDLQVQIWDRHWDSDPADGIATVEELDAALTQIYDQAKPLGLALIPYHLMFAKLKTAAPWVALTSDGVHATYPVSYGQAVMSVVSRTGLHVPTKGLDADTTLAAKFGEETIRQLSALSTSGLLVPDDPSTRPSTR
jgi:hypothetical protein